MSPPTSLDVVANATQFDELEGHAFILGTTKPSVVSVRCECKAWFLTWLDDDFASRRLVTIADAIEAMRREHDLHLGGAARRRSQRLDESFY